MLAIASGGMLVAAAPACAAPNREATSVERYMRVRAAALAGDVDTANSELSVLLAKDPGNVIIGARALREAIAGGDEKLALRAARALDQAQALTPDGPLLFAIDAIQRRDWKAARAETDRLEASKLFAFVAPFLRGWIALAAGDADPLAVIEPARRAGLASAYFPAQHALMLLALGRIDEGAAQVSTGQTAGTRLRLIAAAAVQRAHGDQAAMTLLAGPDPLLLAARARVAAGKPVGLVVKGAEDGIAELLTQVGLDFNRQHIAPVALTMVRLATFIAPGNSGAWIATGNMLGTAKRQSAALTALAHVQPDDPYAETARSLRIALLIDKGDKAAALAEARSAAERPGAGAAEWARVGDVQMALDQPGPAAESYAKAIAAVPTAAPADQVWPYWLQRGAALEEAGDWPAARPVLEKAYAMAPDQPVVLNHLGYSLLSRRQEVPRATQLIEAASRLRPEDPAITDSLGWARFVGGDPKAAVTLLEQAAAGDPGEPTINEHLGDVYWTLGRRIEARYAWRAALVTAEAADTARIRAKIDTALTPATAAP